VTYERWYGVVAPPTLFGKKRDKAAGAWLFAVTGVGNVFADGEGQDEVTISG